MFNEQFKTKFLCEVTESDAVREYCSALFKSSEMLELKFDKDLSEFSIDEMQQFYCTNFGMRVLSRSTKLWALNRYVEWARLHGMNVVCDVMHDLNADNSQAYRTRMVCSPKHLQRYMDKVFRPESDNTIDVIYRSIFWMAFCGIERDDIEGLRDSDIDVDLMRVMVKGREIPLYEEAVASLHLSSALTAFRVIHPKYPDKEVWCDRIDGRLLLRGIKKSSNTKISVQNYLNQMTRIIKLAFDANKVDAKLSFSSVKLSGIFYRMYLRELHGMKADFHAIASREIAAKGAASEDDIKRNQNRRAKTLHTDYIGWQDAFELNGEDSLM